MLLLCAVWGCPLAAIRLWLVHHLVSYRPAPEASQTRIAVPYLLCITHLSKDLQISPEAAPFTLAEVPGLPRNNLAAQLDNESGLLIISGSYPVDPAASSTETILQERRHEQFRREFRLPEDVAVEGISAKLDNGELTGDHPLASSSCHCLDYI